MFFKHLLPCICLLSFGGLLPATGIRSIPLPYGDFENLDLKQARQLNRFGCFSFHGTNWSLAKKAHAASGKHALILSDTMDITVTLPPELRGYSLQLSFMGKGTIRLSTQFIVYQRRQQGRPLSKGSRNQPIIADIAPGTTCATYRPINLYTSILDSELSQATIRIKPIQGTLHMDDVKLTAHRTPFYQQGKPIPLPKALYSFQQGKWIGSPKEKVNAVKDAKGIITKLQLWHGPTATLALPLEQLRNKWLAVAITARGHSPFQVRLLTGTAGQAASTLCAPTRLGPDPTVVHAWFCPAGPLADDLKLQLRTKNLVEISDIQLLASDTPLIPHTLTSADIKAGRLGDDYLVGHRPPHPNLVDVAPYADFINRHRYILRRTETVDGVLGSGTSLPLEYRFSSPVEVSEIRLTLPYSDILLMADTQGNGIYDTQIVRHQSRLKIYKSDQLGDYVWFRKKLEKPLKLYGILYRNGGFGRLTYEFQILATPASAARLIPSPKPSPLVPTLISGKGISLPAIQDQECLHFGFTLSADMLDIPQIMRNYYQNPSAPIPPIKAWTRWQNLLADLKTLNANFLLLSPAGTDVMPPNAKPYPDAKTPSPLLWNSKVWYLNQPNNLLKMMTESCREHGITMFVTNQDRCFQKGIQNGDLELAKEMTRQGATSVPICLDQESYNLKDLSTDTLEARKNYLKLLLNNADRMRKIRQECKKINPQVETFGTFSRFFVNKYRLIAASPHDIWGFEGQTDIIGGGAADFTMNTIPIGSLAPAIACKEYASLSPGRRTMATQHAINMPRWNAASQTYDNALAYEDHPHVALYGGALTCFFNKVESLNFWRYDVMNANPARRKAVSQTGRMVHALSAWGGKTATIPKDVMVLRSRTSEDWWCLKIKAPTRKALGFDQNLRRENHIKRNAIRGTIQFNWCITQLLTRSIPNEIYLLNRPSAWKDVIQDYKVVVLPFTYAISREAVQALSQAAKAGVRIIALTGGGLGTVDDLGEPHPQGDLLMNLVNSGQMQVFKLDALNDLSCNQTDNAFHAMLLKALQERGGVSVTVNKLPHQDIHCHMLERSPREKLVLLVNYSGKDTEITLGVNLPAGNYRLELCNPDTVTQGLLGDKAVCSAADLRQVRIVLPTEDTQILRILPVAN